MGLFIGHEERMKKVLKKLLEEAFQTKAQVSKGQLKQEGTSNHTHPGRGCGRIIFSWMWLWKI